MNRKESNGEEGPKGLGEIFIHKVRKRNGSLHGWKKQHPSINSIGQARPFSVTRGKRGGKSREHADSIISNHSSKKKNRSPLQSRSDEKEKQV